MPTQILLKPSESELHDFPHGRIAYRGLSKKKVVLFIILRAIVVVLGIGTWLHHYSLTSGLWFAFTIVICAGPYTLIRSIKEISLLRRGTVTVGEIERHGLTQLVRYDDQNGNSHSRAIPREQINNWIPGDTPTVLFDSNDVTSPIRWALYSDMMWELRPETSETGRKASV